MYASQLRKCMQTDPVARYQMGGVCAIDQLPLTLVARPAMYIVNSDRSDAGGQHWFCVFLPDGNEDKTVEVWDSIGRHPRHYGHYLTDFLDRNGKQTIFNDKKLQGDCSYVCGHYCLFFTYFRCRGKPMKGILKEGFTSNSSLNDLLVYNFVRDRYSYRLK